MAIPFFLDSEKFEIYLFVMGFEHFGAYVGGIVGTGFGLIHFIIIYFSFLIGFQRWDVFVHV